MIKVFISYTFRDKQITENILKQLYSSLAKISYIEFYIDILHNDNNINPQEEVIDRLTSSDSVWVIRTDGIIESPWVMEEISLASKNNIPIFYIELSTIYEIINENSICSINEKVKNIIYKNGFNTPQLC